MFSHSGSIEHSSLLSVFGLSATSTYNSYLPLIFGIFGLIWGHFWNVRKGRFRGHGGRRGQTTSKSKTTKILNENLLKLDEIQNLASATLKITSWPQQPRSWVLRLFDLGDLSVLRMGSGILFQKLRFWNQCKDYLNDSDLFFCFSRDNTTTTALIVVTNRTGRSIKWGATSRTIDFGGRATFGVRACVRVDSTFSVHFQIRCYVSNLVILLSCNKLWLLDAESTLTGFIYRCPALM